MSFEYHDVLFPFRYFFYNFTTPNNLTNPMTNGDYDTVILEVASDDSICTIVSIQNVSVSI